jgi:hypothetical protein
MERGESKLRFSYHHQDDINDIKLMEPTHALKEALASYGARGETDGPSFRKFKRCVIPQQVA